MSIETLTNDIGGIDIYLLDQILKERYQKDAHIFDAGCGVGRNLKWFYNEGYTVFGADNNAQRIATVQELYSKQATLYSILLSSSIFITRYRIS